jgi:hypothetical protein
LNTKLFVFIVRWLLSLAVEVEPLLPASLARASRLRQTVLKAAFEGRLV